MSKRHLAFVGLLTCLRFLACSASDINCELEPGYSYDSLWNETALRVCNGTRSERICIIGGGSSGVHLGWLLKRRGFNPVLFEKNDRLGGNIWTRTRVPSATDDDDVTREVTKKDKFSSFGLTTSFQTSSNFSIECPSHLVFSSALFFVPSTRSN